MSSQRSYLIGDVHGRNDLLTRLMSFIVADAAAHNVSPKIIFLGDIVDRGRGSRQCLDIVIDVLKRFPGSQFIRGNHDDWFLDAIRSDGKSVDCESWAIHGGLNTLFSYGDDIHPDTCFASIRAKYPHHVELLENALYSAWCGPFFLAHAGIDPCIALDEQKEITLTWVRHTFLQYVDPTMVPVVHGHTIVGKTPVVTENRISLDTGAHESGRLTCLVVDEKQQTIAFHQTQDDKVVAVDPVLRDRGFGTVYDRLPDLFAGVDKQRAEA